MSNTLFKGSEVRYGAQLSDCGNYRWSLWRTWDEDEPPAVWIMLNPSTADAEHDDPTIRRCMGFSRAWGAGGIVVVNLFAWRSTDPKALLTAPDPIGALNDSVIASECARAGDVIAAWGAHKMAGPRAASLRTMLGNRVAYFGWKCLGTTRDGSPKHPLYVKGDTKPIPFISGTKGGAA